MLNSEKSTLEKNVVPSNDVNFFYYDDDFDDLMYKSVNDNAYFLYEQRFMIGGIKNFRYQYFVNGRKIDYTYIDAINDFIGRKYLTNFVNSPFDEKSPSIIMVVISLLLSIFVSNYFNSIDYEVGGEIILKYIS